MANVGAPKAQARGPKRPIQSKNPYANSAWQKYREAKGPRALHVKFQDGMAIRLRKGQPVDLRGRNLTDKHALEVLDKLRFGNWQPTFAYKEKQLDRLRELSTKRSGRRAPDLNLYLTYTFPKNVPMATAISLIESLNEVYLVYPSPMYEIATVNDYRNDPGNDTPWQQYLASESLGGIDAYHAWKKDGGQGENVNIVDLEFGFDPSHYELADTVFDFADDLLDPVFITENQNRIDHGTASLGIVAGDARGPGISGIAPKANKYFAPMSLGAAISLPFLVGDYCNDINDETLPYCGDLPSTMLYPLVTESLSSGDVVLLELQTPGPNYDQNHPGNNQFGLVPVEFIPAVFDAIRTLTLSGIVVIEAGGNGEQNLDGPAYTNSPHQPFLVQNGVRINDSWAILVGAASSGTTWATSAYLPGPDSHLTPTGIPRYYSSFGKRIDVHAWGDGVVTSGYGDLYDDDSSILFYTYSFAGTSSASAIVAGAATSLQGMFKHASAATMPNPDHFSSVLWSTTMRNLLQRTGVSQTPVNQAAINTPNSLEYALNLSGQYNLAPDANIGMRPNLQRAGDVLDLTEDDLCNMPIPAPHLSAPSGALTAQGNVKKVGISYPNNSVIASYRGVVDIVYTKDGSEPNCIPRLGNCDLDRVFAITQISDWRLGSQIMLPNNNQSKTVRARLAVPFACGTLGPETSAVYQ